MAKRLSEKKGRGIRRFRILFQGIVQGVGFRPFLYRATHRFGLSGFVKNTARGVVLEIEGRQVDSCIGYILSHLPPLSKIDHTEIREIAILNSDTFRIEASDQADSYDILVSPDVALCGNCQREMGDKEDRRFQYPFINCTDCGPRFTIIRDLPYDRPKTTMERFPMCPECRAEYGDPLDRRYHAQPVSCYYCGPTLTFHPTITDKVDPLTQAVHFLKSGKVVALKGLGGYHLGCLASSEPAVARLRSKKRRDQKPFALMGTMEMVDQHCQISAVEKELLADPAAPILLLKRRRESSLAETVAPGINRVGFMLPYSPLHLRLLQEVAEPLVMTSANFSDEPIIFSEDIPALLELSDGVLSHDRPINMYADDSVAEVVDDHIYMVRRSRGYAPRPLNLKRKSPAAILALGAMEKTNFTLLFSNRAVISQYIGNTDSPAAIEAERIAIRHYMKLFSFTPEILVVDKHPGYANRELAGEFHDTRLIEVQHHRAHIGALLAERGEEGEILGISMDGTGFGDDGNIWGGEFFYGNRRRLERFGHLKNLFLPSGDQAVREPWRFALSILFSLYGDDGLNRSAELNFPAKSSLLFEVIKKNLSGAFTSSCGRLFDAAAVFSGLGFKSSYEGELPQKLQSLAEKSSLTDKSYPVEYEDDHGNIVVNLLPSFDALIGDSGSTEDRARRFHQTLAASFLAVAERARDNHGISRVGLSGGVFQNSLLLKLSSDLLGKNGFEVLTHCEIPPNDGNISLGQAYLAAGILEG